MCASVCYVGSTLALLFHTTAPLRNRFSAAELPAITIQEDFSGGLLKSNVQIQNTGNTACCIRSAVTVHLVNPDGTISARIPQQGEDYSISFSEPWFQGSDGFWYYPDPVPPGASTGVLIPSCRSLGPERLSVTILSQGIPAAPHRIPEEVWGVSFSQNPAPSN